MLPSSKPFMGALSRSSSMSRRLSSESLDRFQNALEDKSNSKGRNFSHENGEWKCHVITPRNFDEPQVGLLAWLLRWQWGLPFLLLAAQRIILPTAQAGFKGFNSSLDQPYNA